MITIEDFVEIVWDYYAKHGRALPWRQAEADGCYDPYKILVSELMLQQTQVTRVVPKYHSFLQQFPTLKALAQASLGDVLRAWQGLGYYRRAKFLWQSAKMIMADYSGAFPSDRNKLTNLPGVGTETAGAIVVYAFDQPAVFIETNVRTALIHHFFREQDAVSDRQLRPVMTEIVMHVVGQHESPREFYWALMDYGSHLKLAIGNAAQRSKHYTKQSKFVGSKRQIRGQILRTLSQDEYVSLKQLQRHITDERLQAVLSDLCSEGLIVGQNNLYHLA